jgi:hypothetical protein
VPICFPLFFGLLAQVIAPGGLISKRARKGEVEKPGVLQSRPHAAPAVADQGAARGPEVQIALPVEDSDAPVGLAPEDDAQPLPVEEDKTLCSVLEQTL